MKVKPIEAYCAIGPDGVIDLDLVRRNHASAQHAAKAIHGVEWVRLAGRGWKILPVTIAARGDEAPESVEIAPPQPHPKPAAHADVPAPRRQQEVIPVAEYRAMLRCGLA